MRWITYAHGGTGVWHKLGMEIQLERKDDNIYFHNPAVTYSWMKGEEFHTSQNS